MRRTIRYHHACGSDVLQVRPAEVRGHERFEPVGADRRPERFERSAHQAEVHRARDFGVTARDLLERAAVQVDLGALPGGAGLRLEAHLPEEVDDALRGDVANLAIKGAEQILKREVDAKAHAELLDQLKAQL